MREFYQLVTTVKVCYCYCFYFDQLISGNRLAPPIELFATNDFLAMLPCILNLLFCGLSNLRVKTIIHEEMTEKVWPYPPIKIIHWVQIFVLSWPREVNYVSRALERDLYCINVDLKRKTTSLYLLIWAMISFQYSESCFHKTLTI